jgi:hypothetical protein
MLHGGQQFRLREPFCRRPVEDSRRNGSPHQALWRGGRPVVPPVEPYVLLEDVKDGERVPQACRLLPTEEAGLIQRCRHVVDRIVRTWTQTQHVDDVDAIDNGRLVDDAMSSPRDSERVPSSKGRAERVLSTRRGAQIDDLSQDMLSVGISGQTAELLYEDVREDNLSLIVRKAVAPSHSLAVQLLGPTAYAIRIQAQL